MDFQRISPLNFRLNLLSGNLLPMTDNSSFSIYWKIYSACVWLLELLHLVTSVPGCFVVPIEKALSDEVIILVVTIEVGFIVIRINSQKTLVQQLIRKLNETLNVEDENMRNIVITNVKPMETPFKYYLVLGTFSVLIWCCMSLPLIFQRNTFYYEDFRIPAVYSKEPFSVGIFLLATGVSLISTVFMFLKKVSVDIYISHLISLITVQYQYIASRLVLILRTVNSNQQENSSFQENNLKVYSTTEMEMKSLCRQHSNAMHIMLMLKKLLSVHIFLIYVNNVFRFCIIGIMLTSYSSNVKPEISASFFDTCIVTVYGSVSTIQFYILCACFQKLSEASSEITNEAFHEDWYRFSSSIKRTFLLVITASNNIDLRLSVFERFNLSLPSFMSIMNQSYSFALLILRMK